MPLSKPSTSTESEGPNGQKLKVPFIRIDDILDAYPSKKGYPNKEIEKGVALSAFKETCKKMLKQKQAVLVVDAYSYYNVITATKNRQVSLNELQEKFVINANGVQNYLDKNFVDYEFLNNEKVKELIESSKKIEKSK